MQGNNSLVKVYEPLTIRDKVVIRCNSNSTIIINGCNVFRKAKILIGPNSKLIIGKNTTVENASFILKNVENTKITIGDDCMISFNVIIRTGDGHTIYDCETLEVLNKPKDIYIGNHVWIAANITILKGSHIPSNCVIGTGSVVNKEFNEENCIIAGVPAKIVKNSINWDRCTVQNFQKLCMHSIKK